MSQSSKLEKRGQHPHTAPFIFGGDVDVGFLQQFAKLSHSKGAVGSTPTPSAIFNAQ